MAFGAVRVPSPPPVSGRPGQGAGHSAAVRGLDRPVVPRSRRRRRPPSPPARGCPRRSAWRRGRQGRPDAHLDHVDPYGQAGQEHALPADTFSGRTRSRRPAARTPRRCLPSETSTSVRRDAPAPRFPHMPHPGGSTGEWTHKPEMCRGSPPGEVLNMRRARRGSATSVDASRAGHPHTVTRTRSSCGPGRRRPCACCRRTPCRTTGAAYRGTGRCRHACTRGCRTLSTEVRPGH